MIAPVERLLAMLPDAKPSGRGWSSKCPAHHDHRPSLSIAQGDDGRALLHCFAGCPADAICAALGLTLRDLMADDGALTLTKPRHASVQRGSANVKGRARPATTYGTAREAIASLDSYMRRTERAWQRGWWAYTDAASNPIAVVVRYDLPTPAGEKQLKTFRPVSLHDGRWRWADPPARWPLYRLPELADARRVYVTEGERAADAAWSEGLPATTSAHGSKSAGKTDWRPLAGRECVLLPDHDLAGRRYADDVAAILATLTPAPFVKVVALPDLPPGGDIVDFIDARGADR